MGWMFIGNSIVNRRGGGQSWSSYWSPQTAVVQQAAPADVVLTYAKAVNPADAITTNFTIAGKTISSATLDATGKILTLVVTVAFVYGDSITVVANSQNIVVTNNITHPLVINDGNTVAWYDVTDLSTITKDGANRVSAWADKLGSGNNIVQANGANQPLWSAGQITGDGVDEFIKGGFNWSHPSTLYLVFAQRSYTVLTTIADGAVTNRLRISQNGTSYGVRIRVSGGDVPETQTQFNENTWEVGTAMVAPNNQKLKRNTDASNDGEVATALDPGGLTLFAIGAADSRHCNVSIAEVICRSVNDSDADRDDIIDYLMDKYGIV